MSTSFTYGVKSGKSKARDVSPGHNSFGKPFRIRMVKCPLDFTQRPTKITTRGLSDKTQSSQMIKKPVEKRTKRSLPPLLR